MLEWVLDIHPETEFVQIQLNYADWNNQVVQSGRLYEILHERNLPIIVMEPIKGGMLANLEPELAAPLEAMRPGASPASWALRFVGSLDGVATILSGMSTPEQMQENIATFTDFEPLSDAEHDAIDEVVHRMQDMPLVPCTSCRYCVDGCPRHLPIIELLQEAAEKLEG